jgi:hypothetical protein
MELLFTLKLNFLGCIGRCFNDISISALLNSSLALFEYQMYRLCHMNYITM